MKSGFSIWRWGVAMLLATVLSVPLAGQTTATFSGQVTDPTGAVIPAAEVTVTNVRTNYKVTVKTDSSGFYRAPDLPTGEYQISVTAQGFKTAVRKGLVLNVGTVQRVNIELALGVQSEQIVVEGGATLVNTEDFRPYEIIGSGQVGNLPLDGRNVHDLIQLAPGALNVSGVSFENGQSTVVNGLRPNFIGFLVNGVTNKGLSGGANTVPNADLVEEFQELTLNMSAQYGTSAAAIVNVVTKSGTNAIHGTVYEFLRNDALDANDFFRNQAGVKKPALRYNQFGIVGNGPILKDKLFFSASYQGARFTTGAPPTPVTSETPEWRAAVRSALPNSVAALIYGNFPASIPGARSGLTTVADFVTSGGSGTGFSAFTHYMCPDNYPTGFTGLATRFQNLFGVVATDNFSTANIQGAAPAPCSVTPALRAAQIARTTPFLEDNVLVFGAQSQNNLVNGNEWSARLDFVHGTDRLFGEFYWQKTTDSFGPSNASSGIHGFRNPQEIVTPNFQISWFHTFSPSWANEFRAGYNRNRNDITTAVPGIPSIGFDDGSAGFGSYNGYPQFFRENVYQYSDMMTFTKGRHTIKTGVDFRRNIENSEFNVARPSYYFFDQLFFALDAPYAEIAGVDPGFVGNRPAELATNARSWRNLEMGAFIQDDWKVRPNLTVSIGLRYDLYSRHVERFKRVTTFIPGPGGVTPGNGGFVEWISNANTPCTATQAVLAGVCGPGGFAVASRLGGEDHNNFGPRAGFAWDPFSKGKTSVRGGFGISYEGTLYNPLSNSRWNPPFYSFNLTFNPLAGATDTVIYGPTTCVAGVCSPSGAQPTFTGAGTNPGQGSGAQATGNIMGYFSGNSNTAFLTGIVFPEGIKDPFALNYYFGIQHEVIKDTVLEVSYVGTQGFKLFRAEDVNRMVGSGRLNSNYGRLRVWANVSRSWYNALQIRATKKMSHGWMITGNYAWSHSIDTGSTWHSGATTANGAAAGEGFSLDWTKPDLDRGNSIFDIRHRAVFNYVWELPWHQNQQGVIGHILGGWQINGIWTFQAGAHWSPFCRRGSFFSASLGQSVSCDFNRDGERNDRPDAPNGDFIDVSRQQWADGIFRVAGASSFNSAITGTNPFFGVPCVGCNGQLGRNTFVGPGIAQVDSSIFKNTRITERFTAQFRFEMFNMFNRANFQLPNSATGGNGANQITSSIFGKSAGTQGPRRIQFGLKIKW